MARFETDGIDNLLNELRNAGEDVAKLAPQAVLAGAKVALEAMRRTVPVDTGKLRDSIQIDGPHHNVESGYYCDVYPHGKRKRGKTSTDNAKIGFILEYGRSNMPARPWMEPALEQAAEAITAAEMDVLAGGKK